VRCGNELRIAAVLNGARVVGFGVAEIEPGLGNAWEIKSISVDEGARWKQGIETTLTIADQQFTADEPLLFLELVVDGLHRRFHALVLVTGELVDLERREGIVDALARLHRVHRV
jgi:hypothetical protein